MTMLTELLDRLDAADRVDLHAILPEITPKVARHTIAWVAGHGREPRTVRSFLDGDAFPWVTFHRWLPDLPSTVPGSVPWTVVGVADGP